MPEQSAVVDFATYVERRESRAAAALRAVSESQRAFVSTVSQVAATRQRDFRAALEAGASVEAVAYHASLEPDHVREIVGVF